MFTREQTMEPKRTPPPGSYGNPIFVRTELSGSTGPFFDRSPEGKARRGRITGWVFLVLFVCAIITGISEAVDSFNYSRSYEGRWGACMARTPDFAGAGDACEQEIGAHWNADTDRWEPLR
jgi:hypothetical protein